MSDMRAKVRVSSVLKQKGANDETVGETLTFNAVAKNGSYPADGTDEDNTFALWTPNATFTLNVVNPALFGKFEEGKKYYVDFTAAE